jgi:hypothetical protein
MNPLVARAARIGLGPALVLAAAAWTGAPTGTHLPDPGGVNAVVPNTTTPTVLGVDLYSDQSYTSAIVQKDGPRALTYITGTLKAKAVGIVWDYVTPWDKSNVVTTSKKTLSVANVEYLTQVAQADGLSVEYRPLIKVLNGSSPWEGYIRPTDPTKWFNNLYNAELPYLKVAQQLHVKEFVVETEMRDMNTSPLWGAFLKRVKQVYGGIVSYAELGNQYYYKTRHLFPVRWYGITSYPDFNLPDTASVATLVKAWRKVFATVPGAVLHATAIDETGIPALDGAYHDPSKWVTTGTLNETVQARFFASACIAASEIHLRAIYFWNVNLTDDPANPPYPSPTTFEGKLGATAIADCNADFGTQSARH